ncbi:MAG: DUF6489 family protein [Alphaproteobacteria bacterium]
MKITIDIDCSPQEAREFFGLPDPRPLQEAAMAGLSERFAAAAGKFDAEATIGQWMQGGNQAMEAMQRMFWPEGRGGGTPDGAKKGE